MADAELSSGSTYQSLYRRFRPQRFEELKGQDHVAFALKNAVAADRVSHAYLFSGPRGTGKTSTARILAKALNCTNLQNGEPCCLCESCIEVTRGSSLDVHELDAASNNGVDAMRELSARAALGTPGRWKVYIIDEVHMLSPQASNALLKTLEEPPPHVVFVLATTDPQKVLATIRSRSQHFEFHLIGPHTLRELLEDVRQKAELDVSGDVVDMALRKARGSARDALSALDLLATTGNASDDTPQIETVISALIAKDAGEILATLNRLYEQGHDAPALAVELAEYLRDGFLGLQAPVLVDLSDPVVTKAVDQARELGIATIVRAMETLGRVQVEMRDSPDPRVNLEIGMMRLSHPDVEGSYSALADRINRLEHRFNDLLARIDNLPPNRAVNQVLSPKNKALEPEPEKSETRPSLGAIKKNRLAKEGEPNAVQTHEVNSGESSAKDQEFDRQSVVIAWGNEILSGLLGKIRMLYAGARIISVDEGGNIVFALPGTTHRDRCLEYKKEVEEKLASYFKRPIKIELIVESSSGSGSALKESRRESSKKVEPEIEPQSPEVVHGRIMQAFPGAIEVD